MGKAKSRPCGHPLTAIKLVTKKTIYCSKCHRYATIREVDNGTGPTEEVPSEGESSVVGEDAQPGLGGLETESTPPASEAEAVTEDAEAPTKVLTFD